jgi:Tfp pilus assembly protein PilF
MRKLIVIIGMLFILTGCANAEKDKIYDEALKSMEAGDYEVAIATLQTSIDKEARLPESYRAQGISYLELGDNAAAIASLSRSLNSMDTTNEAFKKDVTYYLAEARTNHGQIGEAIACYTEILKTGKDEQSLFMRGKLQLQEGDTVAAKEDFDLATEDTRDYNVYISIFNVYDAQKMTVDGQEYLDKALEIKPENADDYYQRGRIYYYMKDYDKALAELTTAVNDGDEGAILLLGKVYIAKEDAGSASSMYQQYLETGKNKAKAYNGLALCAIYEKSYDLALANIEKGLAEHNKEEEQELLYNEIIVYEYKLDFDTAKEKMAAYLQLYPDDAPAIRENEFLKSR